MLLTETQFGYHRNVRQRWPIASSFARMYQARLALQTFGSATGFGFGVYLPGLERQNKNVGSVLVFKALRHVK